MRRYRLPIFSGVLMALIFWPFYFWPLALAALAPFFYFAAQSERSRREVFFGGCIAGALAVALTLYASLFQLIMQPGAPALTYAVRASSLFFLIGIGALFGVVALLYRELRTGRPLADSLLAASLYTLVELVLFLIFGGYYYASLAHALTPFPPALLIASLGGVPLLIFAAAWIQAVVAQRSWRLALGALVFLAVVCGGTVLVRGPSAATEPAFSVATIQRKQESLLYAAAPAPKPFSDYGLQTLISQAAGGGAVSLVVYPYSPVEAVYTGEPPTLEGVNNAVPDGVLGKWLGGFVPVSTTVALWSTLATQSGLYDGFEFWSGEKKQLYHKRILYPLSDYAPAWLRALGLARLPYTLTPGGESSVSVGGVRLGGLTCSELQQGGYARAQAAGSDLLLSIGFDGFFPGVFANDWSLQAARLRAAENGIPVVRSNVLGPSALIAADGSVEAYLPYGAEGVLQGAVPLSKIPTLYARTGAVPAYLLLTGVLLWALARRRYIS